MLVKGEDQQPSTSDNTTSKWSATAPEGYNRLAPPTTTGNTPENTNDDTGESSPAWSNTSPEGNNPYSPLVNKSTPNTQTTNAPKTDYREETKNTRQTVNKQGQQNEKEYNVKRDEAFKNNNYGVVGNIKDNTTRKIGDYYYTKDRFGHWVRIDKNFTPVDIDQVEREARDKPKVVDIDSIDFESPTGVRILNPFTGKTEIGRRDDNGDWVAQSLLESSLPESPVSTEDNGYGDPFTALVDVGADNYGKSRKEEIVFLWPDTPVIYLPGFDEKSPGYDKVKHARTIGGADLSIGYYDPTQDVFIVTVNMPGKKPGEKGELEDYIDPYLWNDFIGEEGRKNLADSIIWPETNKTETITPSVHGPFTPEVLYNDKPAEKNKTGTDALPGYDLFGFHIPVIVPTWMQEGTTIGDALDPVQEKAYDVNKWANREDIAPFIYMPGLVVGLTDNPAGSVQFIDDIISWGGKSAIKTGKKVDAWLWTGSGKKSGILGDDTATIGGSRTILRILGDDTATIGGSRTILKPVESESSVPHIDFTEHIDLTGRTDLEIQHGFHYGERPSMDASLYNSESVIDGVPYGYKYVPENPVGERIVKIVDDFDINKGPMGKWKNLESPLDGIESDSVGIVTKDVFDDNVIYRTNVDSVSPVKVKDVNFNFKLPVLHGSKSGNKGSFNIFNDDSFFNNIVTPPKSKPNKPDIDWDWGGKPIIDWGWSKIPVPGFSKPSKPDPTPHDDFTIPDPFVPTPGRITPPPPGGDKYFPKFRLPELSGLRGKSKKRVTKSGVKWLNDTDSWFDHAISGKSRKHVSRRRRH
jgi:hypothetical protein